MPTRLIVLLLATVLGWRVWINPVRNGGRETTEVYECSSVDFCAGVWTVLPPSGFQVAMIYFADARREIVKGNDFYYRCGEKICGSMKDPGGDKRLGLTISDDEFQRIHDEAWASRAAPGE